MGLNLIIGVAGGLISALLFYSAGRGTMGVSLLLFFLTPLPSLIAGLSWGLMAALAAAIAGAVAMAVAVTPTFALGFLLALGVPVAILVHLAYLARPRDDTQAPDWYPIGRLVAALSLYGAALPILVAPLFGGSYAILEPAMIEFVRRFFEQAGSQLGISPVPPEKIKALAHQMIDFMPAAFAIYWTVIFAGNLYVAGRVARGSGRLARSWPDLHRIILPTGMLALLLVGLAGTIFASGTARIIATSLLGGTTVAFTFAGLSVIHTVAYGARKVLLWPLYISMPAIGMYTLAVLLLIGITEPLLRLRERFGPKPGTPGST